MIAGVSVTTSENVCFLPAAQRGFRILSVRSESMKQGDPLYKAHVQLLSDRDLSRMQVSQDSTGPGTIFGGSEAHESR